MAFDARIWPKLNSCIVYTLQSTKLSNREINWIKQSNQPKGLICSLLAQQIWGPSIYCLGNLWRSAASPPRYCSGSLCKDDDDEPPSSMSWCWWNGANEDADAVETFPWNSWSRFWCEASSLSRIDQSVVPAKRSTLLPASPWSIPSLPFDVSFIRFCEHSTSSELMAMGTPGCWLGRRVGTGWSAFISCGSCMVGSKEENSYCMRWGLCLWSVGPMAAGTGTGKGWSSSSSSAAMSVMLRPARW